MRGLVFEELVPGLQGPIECLAGVGGAAPVAVIARHGASRALYLLTPPAGGVPWRAERVELPADAQAGEILACAGSEGRLFLSVRGEGLSALRLHRDPSPAGWHVARSEGSFTVDDANGRPVDFLSLAVEATPRGWGEVLAVAGGEVVYRIVWEVTGLGRTTWNPW